MRSRPMGAATGLLIKSIAQAASVPVHTLAKAVVQSAELTARRLSLSVECTPRLPPQAPPQCVRLVPRFRARPSQLIPAVALAAKNDGSTPGPSPLPERPSFRAAQIIVAGAVLAAGGASGGEAECAGGEAASDAELSAAPGSSSADPTPWTTNPLKEPARVPFAATGRCARATIAATPLRCAGKKVPK